ncbi:LAMI_0F03004g1_1 [Lachancea mirantina]|uniref:LAMI_0F03004g1_1 n=1 Tax=Lachancea mirantina TaxID=1230905 RepID=A0A1G4JWX2_9SACH|nr:LAMI_0F03004g1_1 [Lachancea mirantina]
MAQKMTNFLRTLECQLPRKKAGKKIRTSGEFPSTKGSSPEVKSKIIFAHSNFVGKQMGLRSRNKFILMRSLLHSAVVQNGEIHSLRDVSKLASWLWRNNRGRLHMYYEILALFDDKSSTHKHSGPAFKKLTEAIGRKCIPSTYSYETLTNAADTTAIESKNTYKAFCGRFSLKDRPPTRTNHSLPPPMPLILHKKKIQDLFTIGTIK